ncbi:uncharacterized protein BKCO1_17000149 [Diplodia corticola]|uniref:DUF6594 domain-containing protein n=1 Tax=Diplodia corticola TaxID=236234 RepID=A0A1J9S4E4_9PEZI|nr:uncharacterized protein BKCO1_17000149 [Diplodia corticola]OJD35407.1 hypothetical protein BKCO1_17000149 [Diplodia corticola]
MGAMAAEPDLESDSKADSKADIKAGATIEAETATLATGSSLTLSEQMQPAETDGRFANVKAKPVADYPAGYPQLASFIDCDSNFRVYRRFGQLRNRVLLHRQHELTQLEKELDDLDERDSTSNRVELSFRLASISYDEAQSDSPRKELIERIDAKLEHYDALLTRERDSLAMDKPTKRNLQSLINFVWNTKMLAEEEIDYLNREDDFVILAKDQDSPFHVSLETLLAKKPLSWLQPMFVSKTQAEKAKGSEEVPIILFSKTRVNALIRVIVTLVTVALLMIPVCLLFSLGLSDKIKVVFVLLFVIVFPIAISIFAQPKSHELFAATAA